MIWSLGPGLVEKQEHRGENSPDLIFGVLVSSLRTPICILDKVVKLRPILCTYSEEHLKWKLDGNVPNISRVLCTLKLLNLLVQLITLSNLSFHNNMSPTVQTAPPSIHHHNAGTTVTGTEGQEENLVCESSPTGAPTPVLSWYRDTGGTPETVPVFGTDPLTAHYIPDRSHQDQWLVCEADQSTLEAGHGTPVTTRVKLNVQCKAI